MSVESIDTRESESTGKQEIEFAGTKCEVTTDNEGMIDTVVKRDEGQDGATVVSGVSKRLICEEVYNSMPAAALPNEKYDLTRFRYTVQGEDNAFNPRKEGVVEFYLEGKIIERAVFHENGYFRKHTPEFEDLQATLEPGKEEALLGMDPASESKAI